MALNLQVYKMCFPSFLKTTESKRDKKIHGRQHKMLSRQDFDFRIAHFVLSLSQNTIVV
jgi:hypothetical protein